jgi:integrase
VLRKGEDEAQKAFHPHAITITKLLCLTGCRLSEIGKLRRTEFDAEQRCLRLEDTKSGRSLRAIGPDAVDLLQSVVPLAGSDFLFPSMTGTSPYYGMNKEAPRIFKAAGMRGVTCHTLRHTFASVASELGYSDGTIAGLLGHKGRGVTSRYIHRPDQALAAAALDVSGTILRRLDADTNILSSACRPPSV